MADKANRLPQLDERLFLTDGGQQSPVSRADQRNVPRVFFSLIGAPAHRPEPVTEPTRR